MTGAYREGDDFIADANWSTDIGGTGPYPWTSADAADPPFPYNVRFLLKNLHFLLKNVDFRLKNVDFIIKRTNCRRSCTTSMGRDTSLS